jgi:hypothetical protein
LIGIIVVIRPYITSTLLFELSCAGKFQPKELFKDWGLGYCQLLIRRSIITPHSQADPYS